MSYSFSSDRHDGEFIIHHPDEIFGYDDGVFVLEIITKCHNNLSAVYSCMKDVLLRASSCCIIPISESGVCYCMLNFESNIYISRSISVLLENKKMFL